MVSHGWMLLISSTKSWRRMRFFTSCCECTCPASVAPSAGQRPRHLTSDAPNSAYSGDIRTERQFLAVYKRVMSGAW
jgi:hypothetical protein